MPGAIDKETIAIRHILEQHRIGDDYRGGYACSCGTGWDWTDYQGVQDHPAAMVVQHLPRILGKGHKPARHRLAP